MLGKPTKHTKWGLGPRGPGDPEDPDPGTWTWGPEPEDTGMHSIIVYTIK